MNDDTVVYDSSEQDGEIHRLNSEQATYCSINSLRVSKMAFKAF